MQVITEAKEWANGLTQPDFEREFARRFPLADFIPDVNEWLKMPAPLENRLIDPFNPETLEIEDRTPRPEKVSIYCRGCGKTFDHIVKGAKLARGGHEKHCKELLKKKL